MIFEYLDGPAGLVYFTDIDSRNRHCTWGFYIGVEGLPRGTGKLMGFLGVEYAFKTLGVRKLCGESLGFNKKSIDFHVKLGFKQEGCLKDHVIKDGKCVDVILFSLFDKDWESRKDNIEQEL
jgi:RimJ/RimL family protein N-acetyltransferase